MIYLKWVDGGWRYADGIVTAHFANGDIVEIPVGKSRTGAYYLMRVGEHEWQIAPVKFPKNHLESYDRGGRFTEFIHLSGGSHATHEELSKI